MVTVRGAGYAETCKSGSGGGSAETAGESQYGAAASTSHLGNKVVSRITAQDIQKLYTKLKREGRVHEHPEHGHELSDTMVRRIHAMLHRCLRDAEAAHVIPRNPATGAVLPKASAKPRQILTREQMQAFLAAVDGNEAWRDFFYTELTTGLRRGEICGLMWQDFNERAGTLKIVRSVSAPKAGVLEIGETKTDRGRRTIRLPPSTVQRLKERKKHAVSQWIFPEPLAPEKPVRPSAAYYWMKRILREAGLPQIRFHDLRHPNVKPKTKSFSTFFEIFQGRTLRSYLGRFLIFSIIPRSIVSRLKSTSPQSAVWTLTPRSRSRFQYFVTLSASRPKRVRLWIRSISVSPSSAAAWKSSRPGRSMVRPLPISLETPTISKPCSFA